MMIDTNAALHFYSSDNAVTSNGVLNITTEKKVNAYKAFNEKTKKFYADKKHIQSAMLQGWNKFCFTGGIVEFSAKLPGNPRVGGLWPARKLYYVARSSEKSWPCLG
jgi:beta-glucanase (GH16 family)